MKDIGNYFARFGFFVGLSKTLICLEGLCSPPEKKSIIFQHLKKRSFCVNYLNRLRFTEQQTILTIMGCLGLYQKNMQNGIKLLTKKKK